MQQLFNPDSKLMIWLGRFANLFILNLLTVICCLPVITIGAGFTAMHRVLLSIHRQEDPPIFQTFFKAFISNFRQSTTVWLMSLGHLALLLVCFYGISEEILAIPAIVVYLLYASAFLQIILLSWVFVLQCRYENTIFATMKNAFITGISHLGRSILIAILFASPFLLVLATSMLEAVFLCLGFSLPGLLQAKLYGPVIDKIDQMLPGNETCECNE